MDRMTLSLSTWKCLTMIQEWTIEVLDRVVVSETELQVIISRLKVLLPDHRDFSMQNMFPLPHQVNMNRPPPPLMPENDINQQRKAWIHNESMLSDDGSMNQMPDTPPSLLGIAPPNFLSPNHRGNFQGNFRGNRGGAMIRGNNNSPFSNFRGGRGNNRARGRGGFRGNFKGQNQW